MPTEPAISTPQKKPFYLILLWAALIACLYLPTLATPFDFVDDGNLVYPSHATTLNGKAEFYWDRVVENYEALGPFRPTLWAQWRVQAELFGANPFVWRVARLIFTFLSAAGLLALFLELRIAWPAAVFTTALAMWNPYRNEIWTSLTLSEGVAMPYVIFALICALKAARTERAWRWDIAGMLCMLFALGCKNTFAAVVPVQVFFRLAPDGRDLLAGLKKHWLRAFVLSSVLALPVGHYIYFTTHWHPGQYRVGGNAWKQFTGMLSAEKGAISIDFMAAGYVLALIAVMAGSKSSWTQKVWRDFRAPLLGGLGLLVLGVGVYLKIDGICGRYAMPAVWGLDMWIGILLTQFIAVPEIRWKQAATVALAIGVLAVAVSNVGRQLRFAARAEFLWQVVHYFENDPRSPVTVAWIGAKDDNRGLDIEEGIHVAWHLKERGHSQMDMHLFNTAGGFQQRGELAPEDHPEQFAITAAGQKVPLPGQWKQVRDFEQDYWFGKRHFTCTLWEKVPG